MIVLRQGIIQNVAFPTELSTLIPPYDFKMVKREDLTTKQFESYPQDLDKRIPIYEWTVVDNPNAEDIPNNIFYFSIGQWDVTITDVNSVILYTGLIRVDALQRSEPKEYDLTETFKVYGQK